MVPHNEVENVKQPADDSSGAVITFSKTSFSLPWDTEFENILGFAEEQGLMPDFSCRAGTCETCKTNTLPGQVS